MDLVKCCFAGHKDINSDIFSVLKKQIELLITDKNVKEFWVGNYGAFDHICAKCVRELKSEYKDIKLSLVIPYITKTINDCKEQYYADYDYILMADIQPKTPTKYKIIKCNEYMVRECDFMICYVKYSWGGAARTLEYAQRKKLKIINLG